METEAVMVGTGEFFQRANRNHAKAQRRPLHFKSACSPKVESYLRVSLHRRTRKAVQQMPRRSKPYAVSLINLATVAREQPVRDQNASRLQRPSQFVSTQSHLAPAHTPEPIRPMMRSLTLA